MRRIRSKDTLPELTVRRLVHAMGYRYRLHQSKLPGRPDLVFPRLKKIIQVHGCFWHGHDGCRISHVPSSRQEYWKPKLERNKLRDADHLRKLVDLGWNVLVLWECEVREDASLPEKIRRFLRH